VNDLLRDKLLIIGGDLAEAKHRISELEANQIKDGGQLNRSVSAVLSSSKSDLVGIRRLFKEYRYKNRRVDGPVEEERGRVHRYSSERRRG
jgi:hypothetical protein